MPSATESQLNRSRRKDLSRTLVLASALILALTGCAAGEPDVANPAGSEGVGEKARSKSHTTTIRSPHGDLSVTFEEGGGAVEVGCATCHTLREPPAKALREASALDEFHVGLTFDHGDLSCRSCHAPPEYDDFRLANGERVALADSMDLCSQCHGSQKRDYDHGAHGGMTGYWDLDAGPRERSHCLDCHDAHAPAYRGMIPAFPPRERFLQGRGPGSGHPAPAHDDDPTDRSARP